MILRPKPLLLPRALLLLRIIVPVFFMAHAATRIANGSIPQFAEFLSSKGYPFALALVWLISAYELIAGMLIALGIGVRWLAPGLIFIAFMGIVIIHAAHGWFVGEHGVGGMEYSVSLIASLLVLIAHDWDQSLHQAKSPH
jgi:putative oxidoreductase